MNLPRGFSFAGLHAGIKAVRKDLALVACEVSCATAARVTKNAARAACIRDLEASLPGLARAVVIASGNANALTGAAGAADLVVVKAALAAELDVTPAEALMLSTGVLGVRMPVAKITAALPELVRSRSDAVELAAEAIFTTDTRPKLASRTIDVGGKRAAVAAIAKGSGMIAPELATFLAIVVTDVALTPGDLDRALGAATRTTVERLVVDGEMSTNDAVLAMASGLSGLDASADAEAFAAFSRALAEVLGDLSRAVAEDGEGATKLLCVRVGGCPDDDVAADLARAVAGSVLVKAAVFGADPNWGRVLATLGARVGSRGLDLDPLAAVVTIQGVRVHAPSGPVPHDPTQLRAKMREPRVAIDVELAAGTASAEAVGCDLSYDYVKINADYSSVITTTDDGTVKRDDRLANYTPKLKRALLVEALSYAARFAGKRAVIAASPAVLSDDARRASFAHDVHLLRSAGLVPIVVHPIDLGQEIVMSLCRRGDQAVGLAGSDAGLLVLDRDGVVHAKAELVEVLLERGYLPVVSPAATTTEGDGAALSVEDAAATLAGALRAEKLLLLVDRPGVVRAGELVTELPVADVEDDAVGRAARHAIESGVRSVHVIDGRVPHNVIAELFTEKGVGTLITQ